MNHLKISKSQVILRKIFPFATIYGNENNTETKPNETTKTETVTTKPQTTKPGKGTLPQTGKETPMVAIGVIVLLGGVLLTIKSKKISKNYIN